VATQEVDDDGEATNPDGEVAAREDRPVPAERLGCRGRQHEGAENDRHGQQLGQRMPRVERVQEPRRGQPDVQHGEQQHQGLERAGPGQMLQQLLREPEERQDEHKVEEQFQECRPRLLGSSQHAEPIRRHRPPTPVGFVRLNRSSNTRVGL
jgi:hypothetical protein